MIRTRKAPARFLSALLCLVMMLTLLPTVALAAPGDTADNPVVCTTFAEFKEAMESTTVTYVKLNGVSGSNGEMLTQASFAAGISNTTYKVLTIEGTNTFYSPLNGRNDCLIWPRSALTINGTGTLKYEHGNTGGTGAVINMASNVPLTINGNVTLEGGANGMSFGYAIFAQAGTTTINGGSFIGYDAMIADSVDMSAVSISSSANLTINGGNFSASLHLSSPAGKKAHSLSITSTATGTISIKEGTFPQGINIKATGRTISTCGYFDTAKASITAGGITVEATAGTDFLKSTEVIVTDTSVIGSVAVAVTTPVAGKNPGEATNPTAHTTVKLTEWYQMSGEVQGDKLTSSSTFEAGKTYRCYVLFYPDTGYTFSGTPTAKINGKVATVYNKGTGFITSYYDFTVGGSTVTEISEVTVSPSSKEVQKGSSQNFTATVIGTGAYNEGVTWSVSGNSSSDTVVSTSGELTVATDETSTSLTVTATSEQDGSKIGTAIVTVTNEPVIKYSLNVIKGEGTGSYAKGTEVKIKADPVPSGKKFDKWTTEDGVSFADANSATTTFVMPAKAVTVTATYKDAPVTTYAVTVTNGTGGGNFAAGATVSITANEPATGKVFDKWTTSDGVVFANANSATTPFAMPAKDVAVTATYKDAPVTT